jgi:ATP synthase protein I
MSPKEPGKPEGMGGKSSDGDLEKRLHVLEQRIKEDSAHLRAAGEGPQGSPDGSSQAYGRGIRLVSEFVAGILVGGFLGWLIDQLLGTMPLGLIFFMLLGFAAGILNMARASRQAEREAKRNDQ